MSLQILQIIYFLVAFVFTVIVQTPKKLTKEQRALFTELAKTMNEQPPIKKRGIFG